MRLLEAVALTPGLAGGIGNLLGGALGRVRPAARPWLGPRLSPRLSLTVAVDEALPLATVTAIAEARRPVIAIAAERAVLPLRTIGTLLGTLWPLARAAPPRSGRSARSCRPGWRASCGRGWGWWP